MYKFIQKNQKKFLAIFMVGLMVVFILPTLPNDAGGIGGGSARDVAFRVGDEKVMLADVRQAATDYEMLQGVFAGNYVPFVLGGLGAMGGAGGGGGVPRDALPGLLEALDQDKEMFYLLQREAERLGLRASQDEVEQHVREAVQLGRLEPAAAERGIRGLLLIRALANRVTSGIKPSQAQVTRELARLGQRVKLDLVHYATEDFAKDVPAPTAEQLRKHFDEFKNQLPGGSTEQNPFGFGYLVPSRVTLNYLTVPREEVVKAVRKRKSDFDWRVEAMLHYRANPGNYPVTQPALTQPAETQPAPQPTTGASTAPSTQTRPTTRPFEEVEADIIDELIRPEVDRRADEIALAVADRLRADYDAAARNQSAGAAADFGTAAYLQRVKDDVQKKHGVQLGVSEINEPKSEAGLRELKGIGQSFRDEVSFPQHVMRRAEPFASDADKKAGDVLRVNEPSRPFRDFDGNQYVFQVSKATPAEPPADMNDPELTKKVEADLRTKLAFDAATAEAKKLLAAAGTDGLGSAAKAAGKDVFTTPGFFNRQGTDALMQPVVLLPGVKLPPAARNQLVKAGYDLLARATPDRQRPLELVSLPAAGRVVVAELAAAERIWEDEDDDAVRQQVARTLAGERAARVLADYLKPSAVKQRLDYHNPNEAPAPATPAPTPAPTETAAAG